MRSHLDVLREIDPEARAAMQARSDVAGLRHFGLYALALVFCSCWVFFGWPVWWAVVPLQGILFVFLFTLQHECSHDTPFATKWIGDVCGTVIGWLLVNPHIWFRHFHMAHHRYTNDPARDPELLAGAKPNGWRAYLWYVTGFPVWSASFRGVMATAFCRHSALYLPARIHSRIRREARIHLALYALAIVSLFVSDVVVWLWIVPALTGQPFLRLYLLAEHGRCPPVANMLENTRTTFTNRLVRFIAWNMPYHIEHHSAPNVPFHQLPVLHEHMAQDLVIKSPGYRSFTKSYTSDFT